MNKIAQYLNEHIVGEVHSAEPIRNAFSKDGSILQIKPEIVVHPRVTNDIRKIARFSWQLAEKGHVLAITPRGYGSDKTGAAIGKGVIINTLAHLNKIIFISLKNKDQFVHVQPGVKFELLNEVLKSHDMIVPAYPELPFSTVGGAVANNKSGPQSGKYGNIGDWVNRLEVVLANGDLIETNRISKHELNKKKGLQTFEGEIYRKIDGIIEDNQQIIDDKIAFSSVDNTGYTGISKVKGRDGSFDLTPLFIGSQGTLGVISEIVLRTVFYDNEESTIVAVFKHAETARDAADLVAQNQPSSLDLISSDYYDMAHEQGKKYIFSESYAEKNSGTVLYISLSETSDHIRKKKFKQILKKLSKFETTIFTSDDYPAEELYSIREVGAVTLQPNGKNESRPSIIDGVSIPSERREEFIVAVSELASKHHVKLPLYIRWVDGVINTRPTLDLSVVSDKQKTFKLISDYMELVTKYGGSTSADGGEGRLRSAAAYGQIDDDVIEMYSQIRLTFDPFSTLNPGVKQKNDLKTLVSDLDPTYSVGEFAKYSPDI